MEDKPSLYIIKNFDIRKREKACNIKGCEKLPSKEAVITEFDMALSRERELARLYFCSNHYDLNISDLISELNKICERRKMIGKRAFDLAYLMYKSNRYK